MKTITFYSYKGGVGRSLALSNIAIRLSEYKKKVCVLDFDLEAPGMNFKFKSYRKSKKITDGIVDYLYEFSYKKNLPSNISEYSIDLLPINRLNSPIKFIPAGNLDNKDYWLKLSAVNWIEMFYSKEGHGVSFFMDLKSKIEREFAPDFLLIDSRTGITEMSGVTLKLLADEIVILAANNEENIDGSKRIIKNLLELSNSPFGKLPKINFVLTRLPFSDSPRDREKEFSIVEKRKNELKKYLDGKEIETFVIHSDKRLEEDERPLIGDDYEEKISISNDYLNLFQKLTFNSLTSQEIETFKNKKRAEKEYNKATIEKDPAKKLQFFNKAIELDSTKPEFFIERGYLYSEVFKQADKAIKDYTNALTLAPDNWLIYYNLAHIYYYDKDDNNQAKVYVDKAINLNPNYPGSFRIRYLIYRIEKENDKAMEALNYILERINPNDSQTLNSRADFYRSIGEYKKAYADIFRAIELNSDEPMYFATLAEIYASQDSKLEEFYLNLSIALSKGITAKNLNTAKDVYEKFKDDEKFLGLMAKYNIDLEELFKEKTIP